MKCVHIFFVFAFAVLYMIFACVFADDATTCNPPCKEPNEFCPNLYFPSCLNYSKLGQICTDDYFLCRPPLKCIPEISFSVCQEDPNGK
ncbi:hypothetical protein JTE90_001112 [Oedothorax gibbosus]|uniref:Uncharacterized protein n=1 Tax=Oedothorax gibbosus TaxID=931172 RepID=A0AAV6VGS9_9ARAC|nr:hypothetical protein JTE90_001112 [Oedothorax gibbosus]